MSFHKKKITYIIVLKNKIFFLPLRTYIVVVGYDYRDRVSFLLIELLCMYVYWIMGIAYIQRNLPIAFISD